MQYKLRCYASGNLIKCTTNFNKCDTSHVINSLTLYKDICLLAAVNTDIGRVRLTGNSKFIYMRKFAHDTHTIGI